MLVKIIQGVLRPYYSQFKPGDSNIPTYLKKDGNTVSIRASHEDPILVNFCRGDSNYLYQESSDKKNAWKDLPKNSSVWLYWELSQGVISYGFTKLEPKSGLALPRKPKHDQHFFLYEDQTLRVWDSRKKKWEITLKVFATEYRFNQYPKITAQFSENKSQVGITGEFNAGFLVFDSNNKAIQNDEVYLTTDSIIKPSTFNSSNISQTKIDGHAIEPIPKYHCVCWKGANRQMGLNSNLDPMAPAIGVSVFDSARFTRIEFVTQGYLSDPNFFNWDEPPNTYLFVGSDGRLTTKPPINISIQRVGYIVDRSRIYVDIREKILFNPAPPKLDPTPTPTPEAPNVVFMWGSSSSEYGYGGY